MVSIHTNLSSLIAQGSLTKSTNTLNRAIEQMSTGYKINHASDNAANYSIKTNMDTKIGAYQVAEDNAMMGLDMVTTASETINEMQNHAQRLRALAINARNGTYGSTSLIALQEEACALIDEIDRLYSTTEFNGIKLLNQKEYDLPDGMPKADSVTGFIEDPYDYTESEIANMTPISEVDSFVSGAFYSISSAAELKHFADLVNAGNSGLSSTFVLAEDIDLSVYSQGEGWNPIGNETNPFRGTFNGNGHIVSNLVINRSGQNNQGLFGYCGDNFKIYNLGIENASIYANNNVGALAGQAGTSSIIMNCFATARINATDFVGGLVGRNYSPAVCQSYFQGDVYGHYYIGGIAGYQYYGALDCYAQANVSGMQNCGGLFGWAFLSNGYANLMNCYSAGQVIGGSSNIGGLIGELYFTSNNEKNIENCISFSSIINDSFVSSFGNFIGVLSLAQGHNLYPCNVTITNCFAQKQKFENIGSLRDNNTKANELVPEEFLSGIDNLNLNELSRNFQVGIRDDSSSNINCDMLLDCNLGRVVRDGISSDIGLKVIDAFLNILAIKSSDLGVVSNCLQSVLEEISVQYENLVSSRSTIQDADMSEVSATYIQQQILQQASATLMATANQTPAIALQLI